MLTDTPVDYSLLAPERSEALVQADAELLEFAIEVYEITNLLRRAHIRQCMLCHGVYKAIQLVRQMGRAQA